MSPLYASLKDESPPLFRNKYLDYGTRVHFAVPAFLYGPFVIYFLYRSFFSAEASTAASLGLILAGFFFWTFLEYLVHRFLFHYPAKSKAGKKLRHIFHDIHHAYPNDSKRLVLPPSVTLPGLVVFYGLFRLMVGPVHVTPLFVGFLIGYLSYDMTHYACHHAHFKNRLFRRLQKNHLDHHFKEPTRGFGFTSNFWDRLLGTDR
jgi:sterol desaturase/sphingolipid hydroxylase (fatty acid hydroxylase superfamily)